MLTPAVAEPAASRRGATLALRLRLGLGLALRLVLGLLLRLALGLRLGLALRLSLTLRRLLGLAGGLIGLPLLLARLFLLAAFAARVFLFSPGDAARQRRSRQDGSEE